MKKALMMVCAALVALVSCEKQPVVAERVPVTFTLQATFPDGAETKAVKSGWENGDIIFVTFSGVECPKYLKMTYDHGAWDERQMEENSESVLPLSDGDEGTMTAIFLPFAKKDTYLYDDGGTFVFSDIFVSYYLTAQLHYKVIAGEISGMFDMKIPDGFVQFYIEDNEAEVGKAMLWEPHLIPCAVTGVAENGITVNEAQLDKGEPVPGFAYGDGDGYVFTGKLDAYSQDVPVTYNFTRFMGSGNVATATTVLPHTMKSSGTTGRAANITGLGWSELNVREAVDLGLPSRNKWANVNLGAALPTDFGAYYAWGELYPKVTYWWTNYKWGGNKRSHVKKYCPSGKSNYWDGEGAPDNDTELNQEDDAAKTCWGESWRIPTEADFNELIEKCNWTWTEDYAGTDINGFLVKSKSSDASIFLPAAGYVRNFGCANGDNYIGYYFSTSIGTNPVDCKVLYFVSGDEKGTMNHSEDRYYGFPIRPVWKE